MKNSFIVDVACYLPQNCLTNEEIENRISVGNKSMERGLLHKLFGSKTRYFADLDTNVSDLATAAGQIVINRNNVKIDLLIFAAASSDLIEPATANIVQQKLGIHCPVMDIKNACNSVTSAIQTASAFIESGMYKNILIVNGEKLSEVVNFKPRDTAHLMSCMAGYSLGDAGSAVLLSDKSGSKIEFQKSTSWGEYWNLCTVAGGGSQSFRNPESYWFEGKTIGLKQAFVSKALPYAVEMLGESTWQVEDIDCFITHQVSVSMVNYTAEVLGISRSKCINVFDVYGNTAAASIPLAIDHAVKNKQLKKGDKLLIIGMAAGISVSIHLITW